MLRRTPLIFKISAVAVRPLVSEGDLSYSTEYKNIRTWKVGSRFDVVNHTNRFKTLSIICDRLSGYVGRRQYKFKSSLKPLSHTLEAEGIDWHDLKYLASGSVGRGGSSNLHHSSSLGGPLSPLDVLFYRVGLTPSQRTILMTALDQRLCGVLVSVQGSSRSSSCCLRPGKEQHGWRCGLQGHVDEIYFERKKPASSNIILSRRASIERFLSQGLDVEIRAEPNFAIEGRRNFQISHLRKWESLIDPRFDLLTVGFDFRIHEQDPRVDLQILGVSDQWRMHAEAIRLTMQELLEQSAVMRHSASSGDEQSHHVDGGQQGGGGAMTTLQPLELRPGEFTPEIDENPLSLLSAEMLATAAAAHHTPSVIEAEIADEEVVEEGIDEWSNNNEADNHTATADTNPSVIILPSTPAGGNIEVDRAATVGIKPIEYKMRRADGTIIPWFRPPTAHTFSPEGIPKHLPFSPSIIIRAELDYGGSVEERRNGTGLDDDSERSEGGPGTRKVWQRSEQLLREPELRMSLHIHPECCAVLPTQAEEDRFVDHVLTMARKMPFAVPFHLFFRMDPARAVQSGAALSQQEEEDEEAAAIAEAHSRSSSSSSSVSSRKVGLTPFGEERRRAWQTAQGFFDIETRFGKDRTGQNQRNNIRGKSSSENDDENTTTFTIDLEDSEDAEFAQHEQHQQQQKKKNINEVGVDEDDDAQRFQPKRRSPPKTSPRGSDGSSSTFSNKDALEQEVDRLNPEGWE